MGHRCDRAERWCRIVICCLCTLAAGACKNSGENQPSRSAQGFSEGRPGEQGYGQPTGMPPSGSPTAVQPGTGQPPVAGPPPPQATGHVAPIGSILSDPGALQNIIAGALAGGAASLGAFTGGELGPIEHGIRMKAQADAKGMKPEGQLMSAKLGEDGHAQASMTLQPGACYTIVGFGGMGVFRYQINLITAPPLPPQVLAQSDADSADPTVGPNEQCIRNPFPLPMQVKVDMHVVNGQGLVGAQAYKK